MADWKDVISLGLNSATIIVGIKILRYLAHAEFKMNLMWADYQNRHGIKKDEE